MSEAGSSPHTIRMDDELFQVLRVRAAQQKETMGDIIERALRKELGELKPVSIYLDAQYDLERAGYDTDDASIAQFEAAYKQAAAIVGEERGLRIIVTDRQDEADESDEATELWQAIHDRLRYVDGEWRVRS